MISSIHYLELYIEKQLVELKSQDSLNLRLNNILFNPTKTATEQAGYSYSFDIPSTPTNDKILDYANNLSKANKFHTRYHAEVYADGTLIFNGSLTVKSYDGESKTYNCNLVNIKINSIEEIFGDAVLTDVPWYVNFSGASTINSVNADANSKYFFPLISYGAFAKEPFMIDEYGVQDYYSSKYLIDDTNKWFIDSFYPSLNMIEEMKKCFEWKGYTVGGNALFDPVLTNIYLSTNLANGQSPDYNVGEPKFGKLDLSLSWSGSANLSHQSNANHTIQDLKFPSMGIGFQNVTYLTQEETEPKWNFDEVLINPLLKDGNVTLNAASEMYVPSRGMVTIPADGFYKITLETTVNLTQAQNFRASQYVCNWSDPNLALNVNPVEEEIDIVPNLRVTTPIEIQLIKNYDNNLELIKGKNNIVVRDGHFDHQTEANKGKVSNFYNYQSCYPHEMAGIYPFLLTPNEGAAAMWDVWPTKKDVISDTQTLKNLKSEANIGYVQGDGDVMCYDPVVSDAFICGMTTMGNMKRNGGGTPAFIKNGYSWSKTYSERTDAMYNQYGYKKLYYDYNFVKHEDSSIVNKNTLTNAPSTYHNQGETSCTSRVYGIVHLKKNDKLELMAVRRMYWQDTVGVSYSVSANANLKIEAASPENIYMLRTKDYGWYSETEFPTQLNLMNFTNKETKVSDWINSVTKAFNLSLNIDGNNVDITTNKGIKKTIDNAVDIDDRVNSYAAKSEYISYPKEMSVAYKINTKEHGFYNSVPLEHINDEDWESYGDSGYTIIKLNDDTYETSTQSTQTNFSYTWYDTFNIQNSSYSGTVTIPVISEEEFMIDGFDYEESMKHRGYRLTQRCWFRTFNSIACQLPLIDDYYLDNMGNEHLNSVNVYVPKNQMDDVNLSYKDTETSIVSEYFNIYPMLSSNYVSVDTYLTPKEYLEIKGGAPIHIDSDLYYCSEIDSYDPQGSNLTTLKLIKKV